MASAHRLGVVVNVFNAAPFLGEALDSLFAQTHPELDVVVVDDGSVDGSRELLRARAEPRLRVLLNERNLGIPATINRGLAALDTPWVAHLDADDLARPDRFARQLEFLDRHRELALVASDTLYVDDRGRAFKTCTGPSEPEAIRAWLPTRNCIVHSSVICRRDAVLEVGGYREQLALASDYDLWLRLSEQYPLASIPEPLSSYRIHDAQVSTLRLRLQRRFADLACREAAARRRQAGQPDYGYGGGPSVGARLRAVDGTFGGDLSYWSGLYEAMGRGKVALRLTLAGLLRSPLSGDLWRSARRILASRRTAPQIGASTR